MVFSSIPAYLDPANWQQQSNNQNGSSASGAGSQSLPTPPPPPPPQPHGSGSIRPGSMADRARLANIPMPEGPLKCPRCESTNTKFCYFNNYSLTQPRHFCKTCRRYWTRGGALRNVPVGGGCRRNKRSKGSSSSKSSDCQRSTGSGSSSSSIPMPSIGSTAEILGLGSSQVTPLRLMAPLHSFTDFGAGDIGLNYGGIGMQAPVGGAASDLNFHLGSALGGGGGNLFQQPTQQFPFLGGGLDPSQGLYSFDSSVYCGGGSSAPARPKPSATASGVLTQLASVKMEDNQDLNLSRQFMGVNSGNEQYWSGAGTSSAWTDLSGFSSSSTSNAL